MHIGYCEGFGISKEEMEASEESEGMVTFSNFVSMLTHNHSLYSVYSVSTLYFQRCAVLTHGSYVLDVGLSEDWFALLISMAPCLIGYGVIARRLHDDPRTKREGNIYWEWIQNYVADDYTEAVNVGSCE